MIQAIYILKVTARSSESISDVLRLITNRTMYMPGCIRCSAWHNKETSEVMVMEQWETKGEMDNYITSPLYLRMLEALELSAEKPFIQFCDCENPRGLDLVEEVMGMQEKMHLKGQ